MSSANSSPNSNKYTFNYEIDIDLDENVRKKRMQQYNTNEKNIQTNSTNYIESEVEQEVEFLLRDFSVSETIPSYIS